MATKKQKEITAALIERAKLALHEIGLPYAFVLDGYDGIFSNAPERHAVQLSATHWNYTTVFTSFNYKTRRNRLRELSRIK